MTKNEAIELLGGTVSLAAEAIGVTYQAVDKWPPVLSQRIEDRVIAALARRRRPRTNGLPVGPVPRREVA